MNKNREVAVAKRNSSADVTAIVLTLSNNSEHARERKELDHMLSQWEADGGPNYQD